jgi:hypothetical protein
MLLSSSVVEVMQGTLRLASGFAGGRFSRRSRFSARVRCHVHVGEMLEIEVAVNRCRRDARVPQAAYLREALEDLLKKYATTLTKAK